MPLRSLLSTYEIPLANTVLHTAALLSVAHFRELVTASLMLRPLTQPAALDLYVPVWIAVVWFSHPVSRLSSLARDHQLERVLTRCERARPGLGPAQG